MKGCSPTLKIPNRKTPNPKALKPPKPQNAEPEALSFYPEHVCAGCLEVAPATRGGFRARRLRKISRWTSAGIPGGEVCSAHQTLHNLNSSDHCRICYLAENSMWGPVAGAFGQQNDCGAIRRRLVQVLGSLGLELNKNSQFEAPNRQCGSTNDGWAG